MIQYRYAKNTSNNGESFIIRTSSNSDNYFAVRTPKLLIGNYDIEANIVLGEQVLASIKADFEVIDESIVRWRNLSIPLAKFTWMMLGLFIVIILIAYMFGFRASRLSHRLKLKTLLVKGDNSKALNMLKKRLEKHLEILQETRHVRVLTKEEKAIKGAIEGDLDEVDKIIAEQKK